MTKLWIVYDASARSGGPSLNDCLYTGPNFGQSILDLLLRLRVHPIVLVGDIEKAFLMIFVTPHDRDVLRFLWIKNVSDQPPEIIALRFTRVVFGVSTSPFLLNATIDYHLEQYAAADPQFVAKEFHPPLPDNYSLAKTSSIVRGQVPQICVCG